MVDTGKEKLLALAARLVVGADRLAREPSTFESIKNDCREAAETIRFMVRVIDNETV